MSSRSPSEPGSPAPASTGAGGPKTVTKPVRVDKWLWAVRVYKTRTAATTACTSGRVRIDDEPAKPATKVQVGDVVEARRGDRIIIYRVRGLVEKRVGAKVVEDLVEDLSPPPAARPSPLDAPPGGARVRGEGRPTKKERRDIDRLRGRGR